MVFGSVLVVFHIFLHFFTILRIFPYIFGRTWQKPMKTYEKVINTLLKTHNNTVKLKAQLLDLRPALALSEILL